MVGHSAYATKEGANGLKTLDHSVGHHTKDKSPYEPPGEAATEAMATLAAFFRPDVERLKALVTPALRERIGTWNWAHGRGFDKASSRGSA